MCFLRNYSHSIKNEGNTKNNIKDNTMNNDKNILEWMMDYYQKHNLPIQEINLIGIRDIENIEKDVINDYLGFWTKDKIYLYPGTTDPSVYYTLNKTDRHPAGTFHLREGWHEKIWRIGIHKGYEALVNKWDSNPEFCCKPTKGWRDSNYNFIQDKTDREVYDWVGINFHRMHETVLQKVIGKYSAGCQVVQSNKDFRHIIDSVKSTEMYKKDIRVNFNYMLFTIDEIPKKFLIS